MKNPRMIGAVGILLAGCVLTIGCNRSSQGNAGMFSQSAHAASTKTLNDYSKPYLTDDKMQRFISSMQEEHNPLALIFKKGGEMQNPLDLASRMEEFNAFAHKYGFDDYQDYTAVWGRIMVGETQIWATDMMKDTSKTFEKMISNAQADLQKPNLTPEQKKMDEDQIASAQKTLDQMNQNHSKSSLNAADMELVKKYKDQIDAAQKKYQTAQ